MADKKMTVRDLLQRTDELLNRPQGTAEKFVRRLVEHSKKLGEIAEYSKKVQAFTDASPAHKTMFEQLQRPDALSLSALPRPTPWPSVSDWPRLPAAFRASYADSQHEHVKGAVEQAAQQQARRRAKERRLAELQQRQRIFVSLVQTRALFHDCVKLRETPMGKTYTALAPHMVAEAWEVDLEDLDEDVALQAELFVRVLVGRAEERS
jgi:hypothetical protein